MRLIFSLVLAMFLLFSIGVVIASPPEIEFVWPDAGYYHITDFIVLELWTDQIANCSYSLDDAPFKKMNDTGNLEHYNTLKYLDDNMQGGPYIVNFSCVNDLGETSIASTWFWINHSELNKYIIRENIGDFTYLGSDLYWEYLDEDPYAMYSVFYRKDPIELYNQGSILIFDDKTIISDFIMDLIVYPYSENLSIEIVEGENIYFFTRNSVKLFMWPSDNYLIVNNVYFENNDSAYLELPNEVVLAYLEKYPSDLRDGICGDGQVDILNLEGFEEECDGNYEEVSCGSDVGECEIGTSRRECNINCTWDEWSECDGISPEEELCDGLDNDCDNAIDEDFINLGELCSIGLGICQDSGEYVCTQEGFSTECNAIPKDPLKEDCTDGLDNDCDGLVDFEDSENCNSIEVISPLDEALYSDRRILFDIDLSYEADELVYSYIDDEGREYGRRLCRDCDSYERTKSFRDGFYNLSIKSLKSEEIIEEKKISFFVDSKEPRISKTEPRRNSITNGSDFYVKYTEDNCASLTIGISGEIIGAGGEGFCESGRNIERTEILGLSSFDGQIIDYTVIVKDIVGNIDSKTTEGVKVDTTPPNLTNPESFWKRGEGRYEDYVYFDMNITEINFDEVVLSYEYERRGQVYEREKRLCSRLNKEDRDDITGTCEKKFRIKDYYGNLKVIIKDEAGNSVEKEVILE